MHADVDTARGRSKRAALGTVVVLALYAISRWFIGQVPLGSPQAIFAALLPLPALLWIYTAWVLQALRGDELERRIALEGIAIGFGVTFGFVLVLMQLEDAIPKGALMPDFGDVAFVALMATFVGVTRARRRFE